MRENIFFKILCSFPIILLTLYFIPFLGVCLLLFRYYVYGFRHYYRTPMVVLICGLVILLPKLADYIFKLLKFSIKGFDLKTFVLSSVYLKAVRYARLLIILGVILLILSFIFKSLYLKLSNKLSKAFNSYVDEKKEMNYKIAQENDLKVREKQERAKNNHVVICPHCGASNMLSESTGRCKYCRRDIS